MTVIDTYCLGPTSTRGSRIVAVANTTGQRITLPMGQFSDDRQAHLAAAQSLAYQYEWTGTWVQGSTKKGHTWVWVSRANLPELYDVLSFYVAPVNT